MKNTTWIRPLCVLNTKTIKPVHFNKTIILDYKTVKMGKFSNC